MATDDFFRARLDSMIDMRHPLAVLATRMPWTQIEAAVAPLVAHKNREGERMEGDDLFGPTAELVGAGVSQRGRKRLPIRLMVSLLYLKHAFDVSDEELVQRWSENVVWQFFSGMPYYEPRLPCDATQIGRFRRVLGEAGVEELLKSTIDAAAGIKAVKPAEFERVIVDTTVQEKAIAHPVDSRLLEIARHKVVGAAKRVGFVLRQTFAKEGKQLRRKAGGYAHAKQFRRLKRTLKRQRTILGVVLREAQRKLDALAQGLITIPTATAKAIADLKLWIERAERIRLQRRHDKNKLYALHAPEVECIGKGKARKPYEFGVKATIAVTHRHGLIVGARTCPGNPYDGDTLAMQLDQTSVLLEGVGVKPSTVIVDLAYRGVDAEVAPVQIIHRGKHKSLTLQQRKWLRRRQAIEPVIGHTKLDHRMERCWLQGASGDALHAVLCATGYNIRWLLRVIQAKGLKALLLALIGLIRYGVSSEANRHTYGTSGAPTLSWAEQRCWWRTLYTAAAGAAASN
jgi:IS5 family transposase